jgi:hypothetical protein
VHFGTVVGGGGAGVTLGPLDAGFDAGFDPGFGTGTNAEFGDDEAAPLAGPAGKLAFGATAVADLSEPGAPAAELPEAATTCVPIGRPFWSTYTTRGTLRTRTMVRGFKVVRIGAGSTLGVAAAFEGAVSAMPVIVPMNADAEMPAARTRLASAACRRRRDDEEGSFPRRRSARRASRASVDSSIARQLSYCQVSWPLLKEMCTSYSWVVDSKCTVARLPETDVSTWNPGAASTLVTVSNAPWICTCIAPAVVSIVSGCGAVVVGGAVVSGVVVGDAVLSCGAGGEVGEVNRDAGGFGSGFGSRSGPDVAGSSVGALVAGEVATLGGASADAAAAIAALERDPDCEGGIGVDDVETTTR